MRILYSSFRWVLILLLVLLGIATFMARVYVQSVVLVLIVVLILPWTRKALERRAGKPAAMLGQSALAVILFSVFIILSSTRKPATIYRSPELKTEIHRLYASHLESWPGSHESIFIKTKYGKVHVLASGPEHAPPVLLFHAAAMGAISWAENAGPLSQKYRIYAVDNPGEAGLSELDDPGVFPRNGKEVSDLYCEIADSLGIKSAPVIAASNGGFIALNLACHAPDRVRSLVLLGPMGIVPLSGRSVAMMTAASLYPFPFVRHYVSRWAVGTHPEVVGSYGKWFDLAMSSTFPAVAKPQPLTSGQKKSLRIPVLVILGDRDNLVGDAAEARKAAEEIPNVDVDLVESGHLIGVEKASYVNERIAKFMNENYPSVE